MEGDRDLRFLLKGGDLLKVRSTTWKKTRYFKLQEDCKTIWHESKKLIKSNQTCECCISAGAIRAPRYWLSLPCSEEGKEQRRTLFGLDH